MLNNSGNIACHGQLNTKLACVCVCVLHHNCLHCKSQIKHVQSTTWAKHIYIREMHTSFINWFTCSVDRFLWKVSLMAYILHFSDHYGSNPTYYHWWAIITPLRFATEGHCRWWPKHLALKIIFVSQASWWEYNTGIYIPRKAKASKSIFNVLVTS